MSIKKLFFLNETDKKEQADYIASYLPNDQTFEAKNISNTNLRNILEVFGYQTKIFQEFINAFSNEMDPSCADKILPEWERMLGIPDDCFKVSGVSISERQSNALIKLSRMSIQTNEDFTKLADSFGVTTTVQSGIDSGLAFVGGDNEARFTIVITFDGETQQVFPITFPFQFGSRILGILQCVFKKIKPANCNMKFIEIGAKEILNSAVLNSSIFGLQQIEIDGPVSREQAISSSLLLNINVLSASTTIGPDDWFSFELDPLDLDQTDGTPTSLITGSGVDFEIWQKVGGVDSVISAFTNQTAIVDPNSTPYDLSATNLYLLIKNNDVTDQNVVVLFPAGSTLGAGPASLVAYWEFDDNTDSSTSGDDHTLFVPSGGAISTATGANGTGLSLLAGNGSEGVTYRASPSPDFDLEQYDGFTIIFSVQINGLSGSISQRVMTMHTGLFTSQWAIDYNSNNSVFEFHSSVGSSGMATSSANTPDVDTWYRVAFVYDSLGVLKRKAFVNGVLGASSQDTLLNISYDINSEFTIGGGFQDGASRLNGLIDSVKIYNVALTDQEILDEYNDIGGVIN